MDFSSDKFEREFPKPIQAKKQNAGIQIFE